MIPVHVEAGKSTRNAAAATIKQQRGLPLYYKNIMKSILAEE